MSGSVQDKPNPRNDGKERTENGWREQFYLFERGRYPRKESMVSANTQTESPASSMSVTAATMGEPSVVVVLSVGSAEGSTGMVKSEKVVGSEVAYWPRYELSVLMSASTKPSTVGVCEVVSEVGVVLEAVVEGV
jgi:hypothetical protein